MTERKLVANMIRTPDGTVLQSCHRYDYKAYHDQVSNEIYMVDGGISYQRRNINEVPYEELSLYADDPFYLVREHFVWGTRGPNGDQPLTYKPLCALDTDHIQAILKTQHHLRDDIRDLFVQELAYRTPQIIRKAYIWLDKNEKLQVGQNSLAPNVEMRFNADNLSLMSIKFLD